MSELQHLLRLAAVKPVEAVELPLPHPLDLLSLLKAKVFVPWCRSPDMMMPESIHAKMFCGTNTRHQKTGARTVSGGHKLLKRTHKDTDQDRADSCL